MKKTKKTVLLVFSTILCMLPTIISNAAYNATNAVNYARTYVNSYNTYYRSFDADCTNFVSQCLKAGGLTMNSAASKSLGVNNESSLWYHERYTVYKKILGYTYKTYTDWKVSTTWCRVTNTGSGKGLYQYLTDTKKYTVIIAKSPEEAIKYAAVGDVIQCAKSGAAKSHSILVTSKTSNDLGVTYHTTNRDNVSFKKYIAKNYATFYIIKVK